MTTRLEFMVYQLTDEGQVLGICGDVNIPLGTTFTAIHKERVEGVPMARRSVDLGVMGDIKLTLIAIEWYRQMTEFVPSGHSAGLTVEGDGIEILASVLQEATEHESISIVVDVDDSLLAQVPTMSRKDALYQWVDDDPSLANRTFSVHRVGKLFIAIMLTSIIVGLPIGLLKLSISIHQQKEQERQEREKLDREWNELAKAAREGKTGPAFRRLFGVEEPKEQAK